MSHNSSSSSLGMSTESDEVTAKLAKLEIEPTLSEKIVAYLKVNGWCHAMDVSVEIFGTSGEVNRVLEELYKLETRSRVKRQYFGWELGVLWHLCD